MSAPSSTRINADAMTPGLRAVNFLAIASPYLVAAALFLALYLTRSPAPQFSETTENTAAPPVSASGPSVSVFANSSDASAPPASKPLDSGKAASPPKRDDPPAPTHPPAEKPVPTAQKPVLSHETVPNQPAAVDPAIASSMKLSGAPPEYPAVAKAAGVQGAVVIALTIAPDGSVSDAHAISGPALLQAAAIVAVRSWRYRPYLVFGKASPFATQVSINFTINSGASQP